jgi:hypothetical protein
MLLALPALLAIVCGMSSGLVRLGVMLPGDAARLVGLHGALMIGGFFGTLIGLERAVALASPWPYLAPAASGAAVLAMFFGAPHVLAPVFMSAASLIMATACASVWQRQRLAHHAVLGFAALAWLFGNLIWLASGTVPPAVPLWSAFLILTIAGERLEMSRFIPTPRRARNAFSLIVLLLMAGAALAASSSISMAGAGLRVFAFALLALGIWLLCYDIARRTVRSQGLTRYMAVCLLSGYVCLVFAGGLGMLGALAPGHALRDAALHALLLGFVLAMVFGHAAVIVPALTRLRMRWHAGFYLPLIVLHAGLALRIAAGLTGNFALRQFGGIANVATVVLFLLVVAESLIGGRRRKAADAGAAAR